MDLTRAYIVLVHAEVEAFCEDLSTKVAQNARQRFDRTGKVSPVLRKIVAYFIGKQRGSWNEVTSPSADIVQSAAASHSTTVKDNNGVKRKNIERLFYPLGVNEPQLDATWLAQMDSFGSSRGGVAHNSIRALNPPDPQSETNSVRQLLEGLLKLDRQVSKLQ